VTNYFQAEECDEFLTQFVNAYHMPISQAERKIFHAVWAEANRRGDRRAREECAAICNGFDACDPGYIADAILESIPPTDVI
jgi:hypothetical protein